MIDRNRIISAAAEICHVHDLNGVTLSAVARSLNVTASALRRYVGSRAELLDTVAETVLKSVTYPPPVPRGEEQDWLREVGDAVCAQLIEYPGVAAHLVNRGLGTGPSKDLMDQLEKGFRQADGYRRAGMSFLLVSVICGLAARVDRSGRDSVDDGTTGALLSFLTDEIGAPPMLEKESVR